jgi:hypothetical protein
MGPERHRQIGKHLLGSLARKVAPMRRFQFLFDKYSPNFKSGMIGFGCGFQEFRT